MTDIGNRTDEQLEDKARVESYYNKCKMGVFSCDISADHIGHLNDGLHQGKSPGIDGVTGEHLKYGKSPLLCKLLANMYSMILAQGYVPTVFHTGLVIPILKKSTLNPNLAKNYRPVTLSSIHTQLVERMLIPEATLSDSQY